MLIKSRDRRKGISELLDQWADWVFHQDKGELRALGIKSWLGELVRNNNTDINTYHEPMPVIDLSHHDARMTIIDGAVKSLPRLQRETILIEYIVRRRDRKEIRENWLQVHNRTYNAHRKMISSVKDILWIIIEKPLDNLV